jgi:hypothetical protein
VEEDWWVVKGFIPRAIRDGWMYHMELRVVKALGRDGYTLINT